MDGFHGSAVPDGEMRAEYIIARESTGPYRVLAKVGFLPVKRHTGEPGHTGPPPRGTRRMVCVCVCVNVNVCLCDF